MKSTRKLRSLIHQIRAGAVVYAMLPWASDHASAAQLPVPCLGGNCGANANTFVSLGSATAVQSANTLTVQQSSAKATLNWSSFNIAPGGAVVFKQPSSTAIALNRIWDANPSSIFGSLTANGQIYLINANGFLFGSGKAGDPMATVNTAGLIASSLNLSDSTFNNGILAPLLQSAAPALEPFKDPITGNVITNTGAITVNANATLTAADSGRLLLAAPTVTNYGALSSPDGQIIMAAGQKVYLQANATSDLRGLLVEVDSGGTAWNQLTGQLSAPRGNISMVGLMVNQDGRVSASTSVAANGSVTLQAADTHQYSSGSGNTISASNGGILEIGAGSQIDILPEYSDTATSVAAQPQTLSEIALSGQQILIHGAIDAPSGTLTVLAAANPTPGAGLVNDAQARIRIDSGASIDLSGSHAELPMSANLVTVQLRANELANDPTQRNGALRGQTVTVDVRADGGKGTAIGDVTSAIASVGSTVAQRTETGGHSSFISEGDIVLAPGASINVSGGATTYDGGVVQTSKLIGADGKLYDIATADPNRIYAGVLNPTFTQSYNRWGVKDVVPTPGLSQYEAGYVQGAAAGSIQFAAPSMVLDGALTATAVSGAYQRGLSPGTPGGMLGGRLIIGLPSGTGSNPDPNFIDYLSPSIAVTTNPTPVVVADDTPLPSQQLQLPIAYLTGDGFVVTKIYSNAGFALPTGLPLLLSPGSSLSVVAPRIDIDSSISALGGSLSFQNVSTIDSHDPTLPRLGVGVGPGVALEVSGKWTNDGLYAGGLGTAPTLQTGGTLNLQLTSPGSELVIGDAAELKANGGAWFTAAGKLTGGAGGSITLDAGPAGAALQLGNDVGLAGFGVGTAVGGTFALTAPRIAISQGSGTAWTAAQRVDDSTTSDSAFALYAPLFASYGFSTIDLNATGASSGDALVVLSGTTINAQTSSLQLQPGYATRAGGGSVDGFAQAISLPPFLRPATNIALSAVRGLDDTSLGLANIGNIDIQSGSSLLADPQSNLKLVGEGSILVDGTLRAQGGSITVEIPSIGAFAQNNQLIDPGFIPSQGIDIGPHAVLDTSGTALLTPNDQGLSLGKLLSGGAITLLAQRGTVVTESGSFINIGGANAALDVPETNAPGGYAHRVLASAGGSLTVGSNEAISLLGGLNARAGLGDSGSAAAGALEIDLTRTEAGIPNLPGGTLQIELVTSTAGSIPATGDRNAAVLGVDQLNKSGIDSLTLVAGGIAGFGNIQFDTNEPLSLARQIVLDAPTIGVGNGYAASLSAPFVQLGNSTYNGVSAAVPVPAGGSGTLNIAAQQINLYGNFSLPGVASATFTSASDVQLQGTPQLSQTANQNQTYDLGSVAVPGNLTINAERIYPDTYTNFSIVSQPGTDGMVTIGQNGKSPGAPLSAAGSISISSDHINVAGTLMAPFGSIDLNAGKTLTLADGSLLSVSGAGVDVPYGQTQENGALWIYNTSRPTEIITSVPSKQITLAAPSIDLQPAATLDIRGGGDLYAYEWVPGTGGTYDALGAGSPFFPGLYAILPSELGQVAPFDAQESVSGSHTQTVYLSGGGGLAAGFYPLLPARYGLEPGAVLIESEPTYSSAKSGQIGWLGNGTPVVAGYMTSGSTGLYDGSTTYQGFAIYPANYAQQLATYSINQASNYFAALAKLTAASTNTNSGVSDGRTLAAAVAEPADAGTLVFGVTAAANTGSNPQLTSFLNVQGEVLTTAALGGRSGQIDLSAPDLEITNGSDASHAGAVTVAGSVLQSWNAGALTLGGVTSTDGHTIAVAANTVTVDGGVQLSADQILLVAQQAIDVKAGAALSSTSGKSGVALAQLTADSAVTLTDASGTALPQAALLGVSDLGLPMVSRSGTSGTPGATIAVESGATVSSGGALALDAPGNVTIAGVLDGKGASWSLGSSSIAFVNANASGTDTLNVGPELLGSMEQAAAVRVASQGSIDILAPLALGASSSSGRPTLNALTLAGTSINNQATSDSFLGANTLVLEGVLNPSATPMTPTAGAGTLSLVANQLEIGPGSMTINGFAHTQARVGGAVVGSGAGALSVGGTLTVSAVELTGASDSNTSLSATDTLTLGAPTSLAPSNTLPTLVGGQLTLSGSSIEDAGAIVMPSGIVTLSTAGGNLHFANSASITVAGAAVHAVDQSAVGPGGLVNLNAGGDITLDSGATVNVSGAGSAPAGALNVAGGGKVDLSAALVGQAGSGTGGSFTLDAGSLAQGLTGLAGTLYRGGFSNAVDVRVHGGDLNLASGGQLTANHITLTADGGAVDIAGSLAAPSAGQRGFIGLYGATGVTLESSAQLHADAGGTSGRGGEIEIGTSSTCTNCALSLDGGSTVTAVGAAQMGELVLRAPVLGSDVAINVGSQGLSADVSHAGQVIVEPVIVNAESSSSVNSNLAGDVAAAAQFLTTNGAAIAARLTASGSAGTPVAVHAGLEIQDTAVNDLLALKSFDFSSYSQSQNQPQVVDLTVRAAGGIAINGTISDGFVTAGNSGAPLLGQLPSGTLRFVAGADFNSANPLATQSSFALGVTPVPSLTLGSTNVRGKPIPAIVRTGTGNLDLVAAGDVVFDAGTAAYTAGTAAASPLSFTSGTNVTWVNFAGNGGNVAISAGNDVIGHPLAATSASNFTVTAWQPHVGSGTAATNAAPAQITPAQYGTNFAAFDWNVGALGGGDVRVSSAHDVNNLSAAAADSLLMPANSANGIGTLVGSGGGLAITARNDIGSAQVFVADGTGTLTAGGGLTATRTGSSGDAVGSSIAMNDSQIAVWARQAVRIDAVYNPTAIAQLGPIQLNGRYFTYGSAAALSLESTDGALDLGTNINAGDTSVTLLGQKGLSLGGTYFLVLPPSLSLHALQNDVNLNFAGDTAVLYPSSVGQLDVFASRNIVGGGSGLAMSDALAGSVPTPQSLAIKLVPTASGTADGLPLFQGDIHQGDATPALLTAGNDIQDLKLDVPKLARIVAGTDIVNLTYQGQHAAASDSTLISAGRDLVYVADAFGSGTNGSIALGGPGALDVLAARNVNLGLADGITTTGNFVNPNLPSAAGADITVMAGYGTQGADYANFLQKIIAPSTAYLTDLVSYVETVTGQTGVTAAGAQTDFQGFNVDQQRPLVDQIFFDELLLSGREANTTPNLGFTRGYAAIDALFPNSRTATANGPDPYAGNLTLTSSQIYTLSGGSISLIVPGGSIDVGLANPPPSIPTKPAAQLGIVAEGPGNVNIYSKGDVNVDTSRIFTLGGGNLLIWSDEGSIDAGNGSKSSLSVPPPLIQVNQDGSITEIFSGALAGSGIRTVQTNSSVPPGNVDLIAPEGTVNAGDAGIGSAGNLNIAASHVIGLDNIQFGGTSTGVPSDISSLGASLSAVSAVASGASTSAASSLDRASAAAKETAAPLAQSALSWLDVFVTGLGEENCKPSDIECLKRQKTASP